MGPTPSKLRFDLCGGAVPSLLRLSASLCQGVSVRREIITDPLILAFGSPLRCWHAPLYLFHCAGQKYRWFMCDSSFVESYNGLFGELWLPVMELDMYCLLIQILVVYKYNLNYEFRKHCKMRPMFISTLY